MFAIFLAAALPAEPTIDRAEIQAAIEAGAKACEAGRPEEVTRTYAPDIVLSYPGVPDQTLETLKAGYDSLCGSGEGTVTSTVPTFEEILVSGDMAIARITWSTHLRGMPTGARRRLRDMQIWRRGARGWEFFRGVHYPLREPA